MPSDPVGTDPDQIPDLAPDHDHTLDWDRIRAARPLRKIALVAAASLPAMAWADWVATPISEAVTVDAAFSVAFITSMVCALGMLSGGPLRRFLLSWLLIAAVGGTLISDPTRHLIAAFVGA
ncbi:hypothetical protein ACODT3_41235 [Streptomyces sp. 4.24]|uniref:hypothetical protein n=1 Tax=Streptomyces tritrimontium TaxID=3406573 RepID=UPI003BB69F7B